MKACVPWIRPTGVAAILFLAHAFGSGQPSKNGEIPSATEMKAAVETLHDVFEKDYALAEKDSKGKKVLAQKLYDSASKRKTPAMVFACYEEARRLASTGGDVKLAVATVTALNQRFPSLPRSLLPDTLKQLALAEVSATDATSLALLAREEAILAIDREDYMGAFELIEVSVVAAKKAEEPDLAHELREYRASLDALRKAVAVLKTKPTDPTANTTLGAYWTFDRKKWDNGLKYLARGTDKLLAEVATKDLGMPKTTQERTALADLWYKLSEETLSERKPFFVERAWEWYSLASAVATGDDDLKPAERMKEIEKAYPNLFNQILTGHTAGVAAIAMMLDGKTLVSVGNENGIRVWDVATGKILKTLEGHPSWIGSVVVTPDGSKAITAGGEHIIRVWDLKSGKQSASLEGHTAAIRGLALSANGRYLVSGGSDKTCRLWDLSTNKEIKRFGDGKDSIESVAITRDGGRILAGTEHGTVTVYDAKSGGMVSKFDKHVGAIVYAITVTKDGKTAISGARDTEIQVWEVETGKPIKTLSGHTEQVYQVVLSLDEKQLLSASYDKTLRIWDLVTGKVLKKFEGHTDGVQGACYSPDGRTIYSASWDKTIRKWRVPPALITFSAMKKVD
jgi:hypothetical protein